jgi:murein DD-endopeptidase MepM/ murein hydrolase activator NlpD
MRYLICTCAAMAALAGCATTPAPISQRGYGPSAPPAYSGPTIYDSAPRATVNSELFACAFTGSNIGEIGARRESALYTPYIDTAAGQLLRDPTEAACLSSGFGWRNAASGGGREHSGIDLANPNGGWIFAAGDGRVVANAWQSGYGLVIELDHGRGVHTRYAHLSESDQRLSPGSRVSSGQAMARMGATGNATGVHLHYEVTIDGLRVDPLRYGSAPRPTWVSSEPPPPVPVQVSPVTRTFSPPTPIAPPAMAQAPIAAPIEETPIVDPAPPIVEEAPAAPPARTVYTLPPSYTPPPNGPRSPYDAYREGAQRSPYEIYNQSNR